MIKPETENSKLDECEFNELQGLTITAIHYLDDNECLVIETECGRKFQMQHDQECCEEVKMIDIEDHDAILNSPVLKAYETMQEGGTEYGHETWTFYHLSTIKGSVVIRWHGESNGYYSEDVNFYEVHKKPRHIREIEKRIALD